ncbi:hypothetical protein D8Y22_16405 [Salinadaptatus halalkaliphilus]|uniref:Uncharacterized protein n=1 Tax=Salinadaptatus halalkaliphilus TaxID=2419781 RepID=A0A4S3TIV7_9EURY|nr:hypothetical protein [Salinadaptatus halalkaliphilus]THE63901.1 hypothetical protein D8Y22_16405 [Salinadaptatus halalkaliphilus]
MVVADPAVVLFATALATAVLGAVVAGLAYQGARRNDSATMRYLAIGIACIAVGPFLVSYGLAPLVALSEAATLLGVLCVTIAGLLAILYSLEAT